MYLLHKLKMISKYMDKIPEQYIDLFERFPFLTFATCGNKEYVGIVQNQDNNVISMYLYELIKDADHKRMFLQYGSDWWWETNRQLPINIVLGQKFKIFKGALVTFTMKDFEIVQGPTVCLRDIIQKRVKRRNIQLVRKQK